MNKIEVILKKEIFKKIDVVVKNELFEALSIKVEQVCCKLYNDYELTLHGSLNVNNDHGLKGRAMKMKANACDENGNIIHVFYEYGEHKFYLVNYDAFSITASDVRRCFDIEELHHIEIYPYVEK